MTTGKTDIHLHLGLVTSEHHMRGFVDGQQSYSLGITPQPAIMKSSNSVDMLPHLKEFGISRDIILSMGEVDTPFYQSDTACQATEAVPGVFAWMCNLDERDIDTVGERLRNHKQAGAVGIGEFAVSKWIETPFIEAVLTAAEKLYLSILFHISPEEGFSYGIADKPGLPLLEEALKRHPDLVLVGHSQPFWHEIPGDASADKVARSTWGEGPVTPGGRLVELLERYPNLCGDLSINSSGDAVMRDEPFGLSFLGKFQDKLMFGIDMGNTETTLPLGAWLGEKLTEGKLSKEVYEKICVKNAERVFGL